MRIAGKNTEVVFEERKGRTLVRKKEFYDSGKLFSEGLYSKAGQSWGWDLPVGVKRTYQENGLLISEEEYNEHGDLDGVSKFYDKNGNIQKSVTYKKSVKVNEEA